MVAFWSRARREAVIDEEIYQFDKWAAEVKDPNMADVNLNRLSAEITVLRNDILANFGQRYVRPRTAKNITAIRQDLLCLQGMCYAWLYVSGKWESVSAITELTEEVNDLTMLWLSVDLLKMFGQAFQPKAPNDIARTGGYDRHEYKPDFTRPGDPCDVCGFGRGNKVHE